MPENLGEKPRWLAGLRGFERAVSDSNRSLKAAQLVGIVAKTARALIREPFSRIIP